MASALKMGLMGAAAGFLQGTLDLWKTERARAAKELENQRLQQLHDRDLAEQYQRQDTVYAQRRGDELSDADRRRQQELSDQGTRRQQEVADRDQEYSFRSRESAKARAETAADRRAAAELALANRKGERIKAKIAGTSDIGYVDPATGRFDTDANGNPLIAPPPSADPMSLLMGLDGGGGGPAAPAAPAAAVPLQDRTRAGTRENPLPVSGPQDVAGLPAGTWVRLPNGAVRQR